MAKPLPSKWGPTLVAARKHILAQGEVIYAHNVLHDAFFQTFLIAISLERPDEFAADIRFYKHAQAIWHTSQSDQQQRKMALAAISSIPATRVKLKPAIQRLEWAAKRAEKLAEYRNLIAHNPVKFRGRPKGKMIESVPRFGGNATRTQHLEKFAAINDLGFWATLRTDLLKLSQYVDAVNFLILAEDCRSAGGELIGGPKTWPGRPQLRSPRLIQRIDQALTKAVRVPKRRNRRQPSGK